MVDWAWDEAWYKVNMEMPYRSTVLLAEDDPDDVLLTQIAFEKARLANPLMVARDGEEAIAYLKGEGRYADREQFPALATRPLAQAPHPRLYQRRFVEFPTSLSPSFPMSRNPHRKPSRKYRLAHQP